MSEPRPESQPAQQQDAARRPRARWTPKPDHGEESYRGSGRLTGKAAVITGGDSGIGRAVAIAFAREGADVLISYLNEHDDAQDTAKYVEEAGRTCVLVARRPLRPGARARRSSRRRSRSSAGSTSWSTTPRSR